jgi:Alpha amylase, catalytic domain
LLSYGRARYFDGDVTARMARFSLTAKVANVDCAIDPLFGSLADFDALLKSAHARGIKVILDFVPNHTSDEHPWFRESRSSKFHPRRDWYVWRDAKPDGSPPNNWESGFGGPAWTFDEVAGQYYYPSFHCEREIAFTALSGRRSRRRRASRR